MPKYFKLCISTFLLLLIFSIPLFFTSTSLCKYQFDEILFFSDLEAQWNTKKRELEKGVDEGGWIEYWIRVVNFIGNQKIVHNLVGFWTFCGHELGLLRLRSAKDR